MRTQRFFIFGVVLWLVFLCHAGSAQERQEQNCGRPLVPAVQQTLASDHPKAERFFAGIEDSLPDVNNFKDGIRLISSANLRRLQEKLHPFSLKEKKLIDFIHRDSPPDIHRMIERRDGQSPDYRPPEHDRFSLLSEVLDEGLVAPAAGDSELDTTPGIDQALFAAEYCVFTSVGPPEGIPEYGTVEVKLQDDVEVFGWGSIRSPWNFIQEFPENGDDSYKPTPEDATVHNKMWFAAYIYTHEDWDRAYAYYVVKHLREGRSYKGKPIDQSDRLRNRILSAFEEGDVHRAYQLMNDHRLAYLEGHYSERVPVRFFEEIEVRKQDQPILEELGISSPLIEFEAE